MYWNDIFCKRMVSSNMIFKVLNELSRIEISFSIFPKLIIIIKISEVEYPKMAILSKSLVRHTFAIIETSYSSKSLYLDPLLLSATEISIYVSLDLFLLIHLMMFLNHHSYFMTA